MIAHIEFIFQSEGWKSRFTLKVPGVTKEQVAAAQSTTGWNFSSGYAKELRDSFSKELFGDIDEELAKALGYEDLEELTDIHEENCDVDCSPSIEALKFFEDDEYNLDADRETALPFDEFMELLVQYVGF